MCTPHAQLAQARLQAPDWLEDAHWCERWTTAAVTPTSQPVPRPSRLQPSNRMHHPGARPLLITFNLPEPPVPTVALRPPICPSPRQRDGGFAPIGPFRAPPPPRTAVVMLTAEKEPDLARHLMGVIWEGRWLRAVRSVGAVTQAEVHRTIPPPPPPHSPGPRPLIRNNNMAS